MRPKNNLEEHRRLERPTTPSYLTAQRNTPSLEKERESCARSLPGGSCRRCSPRVGANRRTSPAESSIEEGLAADHRQDRCRGDNRNAHDPRRIGGAAAHPDRIEVVAADEVLPEIRDRIHQKFGFVLTGSRTIYLIRDSAVIREAERSGGPYVFILAAVIWHEMAHADGLDEAQARRREEELWRGFVSTRVVESAFGLTYLAELRGQK